MSGDKRKVRVGRLNTIGGVVMEMAKVYREMRRDDLDTLDGARLVSVLTQIRTAIEVGELEERITILERGREGIGASYHAGRGSALDHPQGTA